MNYIKSIALLGIVTVYSCTSQQNIQNTAEKNNQGDYWRQTVYFIFSAKGGRI